MSSYQLFVVLGGGVKLNTESLHEYIPDPNFAARCRMALDMALDAAREDRSGTQLIILTGGKTVPHTPSESCVAAHYMDLIWPSELNTCYMEHREDGGLDTVGNILTSFDFISDVAIRYDSPVNVTFIAGSWAHALRVRIVLQQLLKICEDCDTDHRALVDVPFTVVWQKNERLHWKEILREIFYVLYAVIDPAGVLWPARHLREQRRRVGAGQSTS